MSDINVTPLVDVMLVLLIIFMIVAPNIESGVDVSLPKAEAAPVVVGEEEIIVTVTATGTINVGERSVTLEELPGVLAEQAKARGKNQVYLKADESTRYGAVAQVLAAIKAAGITGLGVITETPPEEGRRPR